ncbi:radical SAM protein [Alloiococcus sp. CFN-8]|uniref:radical SAM protein n=1 Tax=Alloiococcus sp. CFN-8 TaxID=3416081 RepID=UPI003CE692AC
MTTNNINSLTHCSLCARNCGVDRTKGELGFCKSSDRIFASRAALHHWEEPCISGTKGSGTVFFSSCSLGCVFCQNYEISTGGAGKEISIERLSEIFLELESLGAHNINLVTPTHFVPQIREAIILSKEKGLSLPIVYNTGSYDTLDTIKSLEGLIDIYLPDLKYFDDKYSTKYSRAKDYFKTASKAIEEMYRQVGEPSFNEDGIMTKGIIVRHMMLPGLLFDSKKIIDYLYNTYGHSIYISIMNQYTPTHKAKQYKEISKPLNNHHYEALIDYALSLGVTNAFIQEEGTASESFIPAFDYRGV